MSLTANSKLRKVSYLQLLLGGFRDKLIHTAILRIDLVNNFASKKVSASGATQILNIKYNSLAIFSNQASIA